MTRPVIIVGNGVHLAHREEAVREFCQRAGCPIVTTWTGADIVCDLPLHIGSFGIFGTRAANFTVQNADALYVLGASLCIPQTGFNGFARAAEIIRADLNALPPVYFACAEWNAQALRWKASYGIESEKRGPGFNSFAWVKGWSEQLPDNAIVVTDMGTAFTCTFQAARMKYGQRWLTASGFAPMGYALPAALGAHYATGKPVWALVGDGALQFNLATLQQIRGLPIKVIVFENGGYLTMKHTFQGHFGHRVGSEFDFSNTRAIADDYGVAGQVSVVHMDPMQPLTPRISGIKREDGTFTSRPLEDMTPLLPREELEAQMLIPLVKA